MRRRRRDDVIGRWWWVSGVLLLAVMVAVDAGLNRQINGVFAGAAVLTAINADLRRTAGVAALAVVASVGSGVWNDDLFGRGWTVRFVACLVISVLALVAARANQRRRRRLERTTALAQRVLDALAVELTGARTVKEVADGFVGHAATTLGATSAAVHWLDADDVLREIASRGDDRAEVGAAGGDGDQRPEIPLRSDHPVAAAVRDGVDVHHWTRREVERVLAGADADGRTLHLLPLRRDHRALGLLTVIFPSTVFTPGEAGFLRSLAGALTSAVLRAGQLEVVDAAGQRTALLAEASLTLSRSLDLDTTVGEVCRLLVPRFSDWCVLQLLRDGQLVTVAMRHRDPEKTEWARLLMEAFPTQMDSPTGAANVVRTGRSEIYPFIPAELIEAAAVSADHLALLRRFGFTSAIVAPLVGHDGVVGAVTLIHAESGRRYRDEDVAFLEEVAARAAIAVDTAATFEQQSQRLAGVTLVAEAAQRAILAPPPPRTGPVALSVRYRSAVVEAQVGGDLYEVFPGPSSTRLLVGDVRGKGLTAIRTATVVLGEFRAAAAGPGDVAHVAREIDRRILPYLLDAEEFVTAVLVDIDHDGSFHAVCCGHPAPALLGADGSVTTLEVDPSPPLGLGADPVASHGRLAAGDRMLLFTDGLIEARAPCGDFVDPSPFLPAVASADLHCALDGLLSSLTEASGQDLADDVALLLAGYDPV